jgi:hypothetical protein
MQSNTNPWMEIPLGDYERHMSHSSVRQSGLLNTLTKKYLELLQPKTCLFIGIAGGNGLEHVNTEVSKNVVGIDINRDYLSIAFQRHSHRIKSLQLLNIDITKATDHICNSDFIWAALILEYVGVDKCLEFCKNNISSDGHLIITIQSNNNIQSVSPTGIESLKKVGAIFRIVEPEVMLKKATENCFSLISKEENKLPKGKVFLTFHLINN